MLSVLLINQKTTAKWALVPQNVGPSPLNVVVGHSRDDTWLLLVQMKGRRDGVLQSKFFVNIPGNPEDVHGDVLVGPSNNKLLNQGQMGHGSGSVLGIRGVVGLAPLVNVGCHCLDVFHRSHPAAMLISILKGEELRVFSSGVQGSEVPWGAIRPLCHGRIVACSGCLVVVLCCGVL